MSLIQIRCELEKVLSVYCKYVYDLLKLGASHRMWWCTSAKFANIHILHIHGHVQQIEFFLYKTGKVFQISDKAAATKISTSKNSKKISWFSRSSFSPKTVTDIPMTHQQILHKNFY